MERGTELSGTVAVASGTTGNTGERSDPLTWVILTVRVSLL